MPTWLITSTFHGQWLPGDVRGSVTSVRDRRPADPGGQTRIEHDRPGEPFEPSMPGLLESARAQLVGKPVAVDHAQAQAIVAQFQETAAHRGWKLLAVAVMFNHVHLVVEAPSAVGKPQLLRDFKSYAARRLNQEFGVQAAGTWWTHGGSCRVVDNARAAINYVCHRQPNPLVVWKRKSSSR